MSLEQKGGIKSVNDEAAASVQALDGINLGDLVGSILRHKVLILGTTFICLLLATGYLAVVRPTFTSTAEVYVDPRDRPTPKEEPGEKNSVPGDGLLLVESQLRIITSGEVLSRVVDQMKLYDDPEFNGHGGLVGSIKAMFGFGDTADAKLSALRRLRLTTSAKRNERSYVIDISVSARSPQRAADLANAVAKAYLEEQASANSNFNRRISDAITSQLERMRDAVSQSEQAVAAYKAANNLVGSRDRLVTDQELAEANTQLTNAKARLNEAQARVRLVNSIESGTAPLDSLPEAVQSNTITQLRARAADASRAEVQLAQVVGPNHPALRQAQAEVRNTQAAVKNEVKLIAQAVRNVATSERTNVDTLQARFDSLKALTQTNEKAMVQLRELQLKADADRAVYETYLAKAKAATEEQVINNTNIRLISPAILPDRQSWPPTIPIMVGALFAGLFFGVVLALLRGAWAQLSGTSPQPDARHKPSERSETAENYSLQVTDIPANARRDQLSRLQAELLAAPADHITLLVRASSDQALDLVALELARTLEESEQKVVLIDADLKAHSISSLFRYDQRPGVRDILAGKASIGEAAIVLGRTGIKIVPAGTAPLLSPNEGMRSAFSAALNQARDFGRVIIDGGLLGTTSSDFDLYAMADEVIFLEAGDSDQIFDVSLIIDLLRHRGINAKTVFIEPMSHALAA